MMEIRGGFKNLSHGNFPLRGGGTATMHGMGTKGMLTLFLET